MPGPHAEPEAEVVGRHDHPDVLADRILAYTVVTPRGAAGKGEAHEIIAPGLQGQLGLLPGHIPLLAALRAGVLTVAGGGKRQVLAVGPGYVQVGAGDQVRILVEAALRPEDIDAAEVQTELDAAQAELKAGATGNAAAVATRTAEWANARLAASRAGKHA